MFDGIVIEQRLTNLAISYNKDNSLWKQLFPNTMNTVSTDSWYPKFDDKAFVYRDNRNRLIKGDTSDPKAIKLLYEKVPVIITGYEAKAERSKKELMEAKAITLDTVENDLTETVVKALNQCVDLDTIDVITSASWPTVAATASGTGGWSDLTNGDPELDLRNARLTIINQSRGQYAPNTIIASVQAMNYFWMHTKIKSRYDNVTGNADEKKRWFLNMLGIDRVIEVMTVKNTAKEGATPVFANALTNTLLMCHLDSTPSRQAPTAMAALVPQDYVDNTTGVVITKLTELNGKWPDGGDGIRVFGDQFTKVKLIASDLGKTITGLYA